MDMKICQNQVVDRIGTYLRENLRNNSVYEHMCRY